MEDQQVVKKLKEQEELIAEMKQRIEKLEAVPEERNKNVETTVEKITNALGRTGINDDHSTVVGLLEGIRINTEDCKEGVRSLEEKQEGSDEGQQVVLGRIEALMIEQNKIPGN